MSLWEFCCMQSVLILIFVLTLIHICGSDDVIVVCNYLYRNVLNSGHTPSSGPEELNDSFWVFVTCPVKHLHFFLCQTVCFVEIFQIYIVTALFTALTFQILCMQSWQHYRQNCFLLQMMVHTCWIQTKCLFVCFDCCSKHIIFIFPGMVHVRLYLGSDLIFSVISCCDCR